MNSTAGVTTEIPTGSTGMGKMKMVEIVMYFYQSSKVTFLFSE